MRAKDGEADLLVAFSVQAKKNEAKTLEEGRAIFDDVDYIRLMVPGDRNNVIHRPINVEDRQRFAKQLQAWKEGKVDPAGSGTPLREWGGLSKSEVEELAHFGVRTVESLAELTDSNATNIGPIMKLRKRAKAYVEAAKSDAPMQKLLATLDERDSRITELEAKLTELSEAVAEDRKARKSKKE